LGVALFDVALLPGMVIGVAAMLVPRYVPQMGLVQELRLILDGRDPFAVIRKQSYPQNRRGSNSPTQESGGSCAAIFFMCLLLNSQCL
jgi:hypothetical protein